MFHKITLSVSTHRKHAQNLTRHSSHQGVNASSLACPTGPEGHHAMSDPLSLIELDNLQLPGWVTD